MSNENGHIMADRMKSILTAGGYEVNGNHVDFPLTSEKLSAAQVLIPESAQLNESFCGSYIPQNWFFAIIMMEGISSNPYEKIIRQARECFSAESADPYHIPLVFNVTSPSVSKNPQFKDNTTIEELLLCTSTLQLSMDSNKAESFYRYDSTHPARYGNDVYLYSPNVLILQNSEGVFLNNPVRVAVLSCAIPAISINATNSYELRKAVLSRIEGMLMCAARLGHRALILPSFGCEVYGNDPKEISNLIRIAFHRFSYHGKNIRDCFRISFAIPHTLEEKRIYKCFDDRFFSFKQEEEILLENETLKNVDFALDSNDILHDRIRGCLIGGAAGDALGYAIEFLPEDAIYDHYGESGITDYATEKLTGCAVISDDTQMTLFTAAGILSAEGISPLHEIAKAYDDWLKTQECSFVENQDETANMDYSQRLMQLSTLWVRRAPGNTCLSALGERKRNAVPDCYEFTPLNHSKGCGGVMRVAPIGFLNHLPDDEIYAIGSHCAAITHGHSLGYMPASVLTNIIHLLAYRSDNTTLLEVVVSAREKAKTMFMYDPYCSDLLATIDKAIELSQNSLSDLENIHAIGQGWTGDEALAIAIYCSLRHTQDFSAALTAAVNHNGDSDSTGAITGQILGTLHGYSTIDGKWKRGLELSEEILRVADDYGDWLRERSLLNYHAATVTDRHRYMADVYVELGILLSTADKKIPWRKSLWADADGWVSIAAIIDYLHLPSVQKSTIWNYLSLRGGNHLYELSEDNQRIRRRTRKKSN